MAKEIERKFLVKGDAWKTQNRSVYRQGYLSIDPERIVRVRTADQKAYLTIKGKTVGMTRQEFEYEIPLAEAIELLENLCQKPLLEKTRYQVPFGNVVFEVEEYHGENKGLVVAEVEMKHEDQKIPKPDWLGDEVTGDPRYYNSNLINNPYRNFRSESTPKSGKQFNKD